MKKLRKKERRRGQTTIEYMLLLGMVAGVIALARQILEPKVVENIRALVTLAQTEAWVGGSPATKDAPYGVYYSQSQMKTK